MCGFSHPEWETKGSVVWLESNRSSLLQDGLVGCMQPFAHSWCWIIIVVMMTSWGVVIVVVNSLVGIVVLLLPEEVGVEVPVEDTMCLVYV